MKKTIYPKLLGGYLLFGILGFIVISTFTAHFSFEYIEQKEVSNLYKEVNLVASDYAVSYYSNDITLAVFEDRLKALDNYLSADIWVVSTNGDILVNSAKKNRSFKLRSYR